MVRGNFNRVLEVVLARIIPGAVNVLAILWVGNLLAPEGYGLFSTGLATSVMVANLSFGLLTYTVVPRHAEFSESGYESDFEAKVLGCAIVISLIVLALGGFASSRGLPTSFVFLILSMGLFSTAQSILRARLQFWRYGLAAFGQATALLAFLLIYANPESSPETILLFYMIGYAVGACVSLLLVGFRLPKLPSRRYLIDVFSTGLHFTVANFAENMLQLGFRYALLVFAPPSVLGTFSFALDMAQRLVGVILNITSFALLPMIYKRLANGDKQKSRRLIWLGNLLSGSMALIVLFGAMLVIQLGVVAGLNAVTLSLPAFFFISLAAIINRLKKMSLDPLAVESGQTRYLPVAYGLATPASVGLAAGLSVFSMEQLTYPAYTLIYVFVAALTARLLGVSPRKLLRGWKSVPTTGRDRTGSE